MGKRFSEGGSWVQDFKQAFPYSRAVEYNDNVSCTSEHDDSKVLTLSLRSILAMPVPALR